MYKIFLKMLHEFIELICEIKEDAKESLKKFEENFHKSMDELELANERDKMEIFFQTEEEWENFCEEAVKTIKLTIVFVAFYNYYYSLDDIINISATQELQHILIPIDVALRRMPSLIVAVGPTWNQNLGLLYIPEVPQFHSYSKFVSQILLDIRDFDLEIGVNWFLF